MPLKDTLKDTFESGGFDLGTTFSTLSTSTSGISVQGAGLDQSALTEIAGRLGQGDLGAIGTSAGGILGAAGNISAALPQPDVLLQPLRGALDTASSLANADPQHLLQLFEQAGAAGNGQLGLAGLAGPIAALGSVRSDPLVGPVLQLASRTPGGLQIDQTVSRFGAPAKGIAALAELIGALMATEALTREIATTAEGIGRMLDAGAIDGALSRLGTAVASSDLAAVIAAASPDDPDEVAAVAPTVIAFADAIRGAADRLVTGMAYSEATLVGGDVDTLAAGLAQASDLLSESSLQPVRDLATEAAGWVEPLLRIDLGSPSASLDAFLGEITGLLGQLTAAIDAIDPATIARPVTNALAAVLAPLRQVEEIAHQITATIRSALHSAQQAIASIDLRPVVEAIQSAIQPAVDALHELDQLIAAAKTELETLAGDVTSALTTLKSELDAAAADVHDAFQGVKTTVEGLGLADLQAQIEQELQSVTDTLKGAEVTPYFDTAIQAMDAVRTVVAAVPISLLPDSTRQELDDAVQPIKDIDFQTEVADVLENALQEILDALNTDVLDEIDALYKEVVGYIESINPRPALQQFEQEDFDPMLARIRAIDPTEVLKPVSDVIDQVKAAVAGLDIRAEVLGPLESAFDELEHGFAQLDPAAMLEPLEQQVGRLRKQIAQALQLDLIQQKLALVDPTVTRILAGLDFNLLVSLLDAAWGQLAPSPDPAGPSALGTAASALLEGTGLRLRVDSLDVVMRWLGGADAAGEVTARLGGAATALDEAHTVLRRIDPAALVASLQPTYTSVKQAVDALPEGSLLRTRLEPVLAGASPLDVLGTTIDNHARLLLSLEALAALVRGLAASGRSEVTVIVQGLRDALRPLIVIPDRLKAMLVRIGLDVTGKSLRQLLAELFDEVRPSRLLAPLAPAVASLKAKVAALIHEGLVAPLTGAVGTVRDALDVLDISFIRTELKAIHDQIAADIHELRPSVLLAPALDAFDQTKAMIAAFDPLAPVRAVIDAMKAVIEDVANHYRPTVLFAPILDLYDEIVTALGGLDVHKLLDPILKALADIKTQLDQGLDGAAASLKQLQEALP